MCSEHHYEHSARHRHFVSYRLIPWSIAEDPASAARLTALRLDLCPVKRRRGRRGLHNLRSRVRELAITGSTGRSRGPSSTPTAGATRHRRAHTLLWFRTRIRVALARRMLAEGTRGRNGVRTHRMVLIVGTPVV